MTIQSGGFGWLSAQLFFRGDLYDTAADQVILEIVEPICKRCLGHGWARRFFFIRYGNMGSHIRLRFYGRLDLLEQRVKPGIVESCGKDSTIQRIEWDPYAPEVDRYGGPCGVAFAERVFHESSETAFALLLKVDATRRSTRLGKGLLTMLVMLHTFRDSRAAAADFIAAYGSNYLYAMVPDPDQRAARIETFREGYDKQARQLSPYVETAWAALEGREALTDELDRYRERLLETRRRLERLADTGRLRDEHRILAGFDVAVDKIVPSYLHMMNNRLGITTQEESYLSLVIHQTLAAQPVATQAVESK